MFPVSIEDEDVCPEADRLACAVIYLMSCHARTQCPRLAAMIRHHLELIASHPGAGERVAFVCRQLSPAWDAIRLQDEKHRVAQAPTH